MLKIGDTVRVDSRGRSNDGFVGVVVSEAQGPEGLWDVEFQGAPYPYGSYPMRELKRVSTENQQ